MVDYIDGLRRNWNGTLAPLGFACQFRRKPQKYQAPRPSRYDSTAESRLNRVDPRQRNSPLPWIYSIQCRIHLLQLFCVQGQCFFAGVLPRLQPVRLLLLEPELGLQEVRPNHRFFQLHGNQPVQPVLADTVCGWETSCESLGRSLVL